MVGVISSRAKRLAVVCAAAALLGLVFVGSLSQPAGAAFPGHNGRIAFDRVGHDPDSEIFTAKASGSHQRQLTHNSVNDRDPAFSPNGRQIVFDVNETSIYRMRADGSTSSPSPTAGHRWRARTPTGSHFHAITTTERSQAPDPIPASRSR